MKPIEERKAEFKKLVWEAAGKNFDTYSKELLADFFTHWTATKINGRVMGFEKEKTFDIKRRLQTWKRNGETNFGRYKPGTMIPRTWPSTLNLSLLKRLDGNEWWDYVKHLKKLGYEYKSSPTGSYFKKPDGQYQWL